MLTTEGADDQAGDALKKGKKTEAPEKHVLDAIFGSFTKGSGMFGIGGTFPQTPSSQGIPNVLRLQPTKECKSCPGPKILFSPKLTCNLL